jgi:small-conductance mechanosensitive channel
MRPPDLLFGNDPVALAWAGGISGLVFLLVWFIRAFARRKLRDAHLTKSDVDDFFFDLAKRTKLLLLFLPIVHLGARTLTLPTEIVRMLAVAVPIFLIAQAALWLAGAVDFAVGRYRRTRVEHDPSAVMTLNVFRIALVAAVWILAVIVAIDNLGFNVGAVLTGLGIGGVAVALALQNILGDLFASLSIVIDKPFILGDAISVDSFTGTVEHIGLKTTRIRSVSGEEVVFSNGDLLKSRIRNFARMTQRRAQFRLQVALQTPAEKLERVPLLLRASVEKQPKARFDRAHFVAITAAAFEFELVYYVDSAEHGLFLDTQQGVNVEIVRSLAAEEVELVRPGPAGCKEAHP